MNITMNDVIAFIERAIKENLVINTAIKNYSNLKEFKINIYKNNFSITISYFKEYNNRTLQISSDTLDSITIPVESEMDEALFTISTLKAHEYSKNKTIEDFNNFFNKKYSEITIEDLDDLTD